MEALALSIILSIPDAELHLSVKRILAAITSENSNFDDNEKFETVKMILRLIQTKLGTTVVSNEKIEDFSIDADLHEVSPNSHWTSRFGAVVWSRDGKQFPFWPSYICDPRLLAASSANKKTKLKEISRDRMGKKYLVFYFGSNNYGFVAPNQIQDYLEFRCEHENQPLGKKKYIAEMQTAIMVADEEVLREPVYRTTWIKTQFSHHANRKVPSARAETEVTAAADSTTDKKKRGRPPKNSKPIDESAVVDISSPLPDTEGMIEIAVLHPTVSSGGTVVDVTTEAPPRKLAKLGNDTRSVGGGNSTLDHAKMLIRYVTSW